MLEEGFNKGVMYRVYGLRLDSNFEVRSAPDKNFYLRLTVEKIRAFSAFTEKCLRAYGFCFDDGNFAFNNLAF